MDELLLGVDVGTSSTKAVLVAPDGRIVARASREHGLSMPRAGHVEQDAEADWWGGVRAVCSSVLDGAGTRAGSAAVRGVCVSGTGPCLVPCDAGGRPLRPAILYGIDSRASSEVEFLSDALGVEAIVARCGSALSSQALGPKLLWVRRHEPEVWERMASWHMPASFVAMRLCGETALDHHSASQCDPFYDLTVGGWADDWVAQLLPGCPLPRLVWPGEQLGSVSAAAASATGLPAGIPVFAGTIDAWAEALSVGVREPGDLMLMYGSTMFAVQVIAAGAAAASPPLWRTQGVHPGRPTYAGGMATSGTLLAWWRDLVGASWKEVVAEAAASPPGSGGLLMLPYFAGERTPIDDPSARGVVAGLSLRHTRGDLVRAAHEGVAFGVRQMVAQLDHAAGPAGRVVAVGGGLQGGLLAQIVSDVTGREQLLPAETVGAAYGDALLAALGCGLAPADTDWSTITGAVQPDSTAHAAYEELTSLHDELYRATVAVVHVLANHQAS